MAIKFDMSKFSKGKAQERMERPAVGGGDGVWNSVLDVARAPYPITWWKPAVGFNIVDIMAVEVTNPKNPAVVHGDVQNGDYDFSLGVWTHPKAIGDRQVPHVCLKRNYGWSCPRCEAFFLTPEKGGKYVKGVKGSGDQDHRSSERGYFLVVPRKDINTPGEEAFLWDAPTHQKAGFDIRGEAGAMANGGHPVFFWFPTDEGRTVTFDALKGEKENSLDFKRIRFVPRTEAVGQMLNEKFSFSLDSLLVVPTAQSMEADMYGGPAEEPERTSSASTRREYTREEADVPAKQDPDLDYSKNVPVPGTDKVPKDEAPKPTPTPSNPPEAGNKCPSSLVFGESVNETPEPRACRTCAAYDACLTASELKG